MDKNPIYHVETPRRDVSTGLHCRLLHSYILFFVVYKKTKYHDQDVLGPVRLGQDKREPPTGF